jgi:hypothetical protein
MLRENYKKEIATVLKYFLQGFKKDCTPRVFASGFSIT